MLQCDDGEAKCKQDDHEMVVRSGTKTTRRINMMTNESHLLNMPFHVLEMIMELCVGVECLNFRATCKLCYLAAPMIRWSNATARTRLQTYLLTSPWLVVFERDRGIISFTDPMFGDKYFVKASPELFYYGKVLCCRYGWLLLLIGHVRLAFFNPFTSDIRELPQVPHLDNFCFSSPPNSPDCMVVGFRESLELTVYIHFVAKEPIWYISRLNFGGADPYSFNFPTFCGGDIYALCNEGRLEVFRDIRDDHYSWEVVVDEAPRSSCSANYFLVKRDEHVLLVMVGVFGESVEVFEVNNSTGEWEKMDGLGRHMIYICDATCLCMEAKTPEMENKIYFPRMPSENGRMVFYSMETCRYHTFNGRNVGEEDLKDFFGTKNHMYPHAWIEPSWC